MSTSRNQQIQQLEQERKTNPRREGITRPYSATDVVNLRGSVNPECTLAQKGAAKLWELLHGGSRKGYVNCLGALTGSGFTAGKSRCRSHLPLWLAGGRGCKLGIQHVSGSITVSR